MVTLGRLLGRPRAAGLLDAFAGLAPGGLALVDPDGSAIAGDLRGGRDDDRRLDVRLPDGSVIGGVVAAATAPQGVVNALRASVEAVAAQSHDRRMVAREALDRYRELALLYRLAGTLGAALDPSGIVDQLLAEAQRALRCQAVLVIPQDEERLKPATIGSGDLVERARARVQPYLDRIVPERETLTLDDGAGASLLATPIVAAHGLAATLVLARTPGTRPFESPDQRLAVALAEHASVALERVHLQAHDAERRRLEQEVSLGRRIQRSLLPQRAPEVDGWSFATHYEAASQVGGDFYDVFRLRDRPGAFGLVMADVTGKGIAAALLMAFARPLFRAIADQYGGPAAALTQANRVLVLERPTPLFITAFMGIVDAATGVLRYASAGHEPPLVIPAGRSRVRRLPGQGPLLGAFPTIALAEHITQLHEGDLLLLHTDGAIDARDAGGRRFGDIRLGRMAGSARGRSAEELVVAVAGAVSRFAAGAPAADDLALLAVRRDPLAGPEQESGAR